MGGKVVMTQLNELNKKDRTVHWLNTHQAVNLSCIHCQEALELDSHSLVCTNGHRFDMAKQGYFFMARKASNTKYDASLFHSRREIILNTKLYRPLHEYIGQYLDGNYQKDISMIDAGSGEGSHLWQMSRQVKDNEYRLIGVDLAKSAIQAATDYNGHMLSMIADLAELPVADQQIDIIFSIFSPSNYSEFERILKPEGELIKIIPNSGYLQEIRQALIDMEIGNIHPYSNEDVIEVFKTHYPEAKIKEIKATQKLTDSQLEDLVVMTPLTWQLSDEERQTLLTKLDGFITLDVTVLHGNK